MLLAVSGVALLVTTVSPSPAASVDLGNEFMDHG
jgi:hypothetical protein